MMGRSRAQGGALLMAVSLALAGCGTETSGSGPATLDSVGTTSDAGTTASPEDGVSASSGGEPADDASQTTSVRVPPGTGSWTSSLDGEAGDLSDAIAATLDTLQRGSDGSDYSSISIGLEPEHGKVKDLADRLQVHATLRDGDAFEKWRVVDGDTVEGGDRVEPDQEFGLAELAHSRPLSEISPDDVATRLLQALEQPHCAGKDLRSVGVERVALPDDHVLTSLSCSVPLAEPSDAEPAGSDTYLDDTLLIPSGATPEAEAAGFVELWETIGAGDLSVYAVSSYGGSERETMMASTVDGVGTSITGDPCVLVLQRRVSTSDGQMFVSCAPAEGQGPRMPLADLKPEVAGRLVEEVSQTSSDEPWSLVLQDSVWESGKDRWDVDGSAAQR